ncbi:MAG TPA: hypothetical protein VMT01_00635 [Candidatus Acidoferrum sp.]|nr:hypothetical protein [Candidatus Acidoferrum sp.]
MTMLSGTHFALIFFALTLCISVYGINEMQSIYRQSYVIYVSKVSETPNHYFVLENPDVYVLKAISSQDYVNIQSPEDTKIDDLIRTEETSYLKYNGTYYVAGCFFENASPPAVPLFLITAGTVLSALSIIITATLKTVPQTRNRHLYS